MKVLIAEDSAVYTRMLTCLLTSWGYEVQAVTNGDDALATLQNITAPQLAILDWSMPGMSGIQVCRQLRIASSKAYTYILLLTGHTDRENLIQAFDAGVDDYLTKPFNDRELEARLRAGRRIVTLHDNLVSISETLRHQACHDALTGVWNRGAILDFLERQLARTAREGNSTVSVILGDIDHFKQINDRYGHTAGDSALRETAQVMRKSIRTYDGIGRYGGEEFVIVLPGCSLEDAVARANEIRVRLATKPIASIASPISITISMGVAAARSADDLERVLADADRACYRAKANGHNLVEAAPEITGPAAGESSALRKSGHEGMLV